MASQLPETARRPAATRAALHLVDTCCPAPIAPVTGYSACIFIHCGHARKCALMPPTGSSELPWCWHPRLSCLLRGAPSPLAAKLAAGHGAGVSGNPGRDVGRVHEDPGRFVAEGWTPALDLQWRSGLGTSRWSSPVRSRSPGVGGCDCPARPHPYPVVTLSDMGGQGERAPSRRHTQFSSQRFLPPSSRITGVFWAIGNRAGRPWRGQAGGHRPRGAAATGR
jgi:hypothetical protein